MTSNVIGEKKESVSSVDCMTAALPAGTLSGAPKIRAMEILHEIENRNRGIYGGSVGYFGFNGSLDTAIVIRTALHTDKSLTVGVGGGIVHDSIPENEWNETVLFLIKKNSFAKVNNDSDTFYLKSIFNDGEIITMPIFFNNIVEKIKFEYIFDNKKDNLKIIKGHFNSFKNFCIEYFQNHKSIQVDVSKCN